MTAGMAAIQGAIVAKWTDVGGADAAVLGQGGADGGCGGAARLAAGATHTLLLDSDGHLLTFGNKKDDVLGRSPSTAFDDAARVDFDAETRERLGGAASGVACGATHCAVWSTDGGRVLSWGFNGFGQLGGGGTDGGPGLTALDVDPGRGIRHVAAGFQHGLLVDDGGCVLAWGSEIFGQLGSVGVSDATRPVEVEALRGVDVVAVAGGYGHSVAVASDGDVFLWGLNDHGQVDPQQLDRRQVMAPVRLAGLDVVQATCGLAHTVLRTRTGGIVTLGSNLSAQLGSETSTRRDHGPLTIEYDDADTDPIVDIDAGSMHTLARTAAGRLLGWGLAGDGQLARSTRDNVRRPASLLEPGEKAVAMAAGWSHSAAVLAQ